MKIRFGYVAISLALPITSSSQLTYTYFKRLGLERAMGKLDSVIRSNLEALYEILRYNYKNEVHFFRMTSNLIPLATLEDVSFDYITPYQKEYQKIASFVTKHQMRLDMHPDQYVVLNSDRDSVVKQSIENLIYQDRLLEALGQREGKLVLHVGGKSGGKRAGMKRFMDNFSKLPLSVQQRIVLENDDKVYNIRNVLQICEKLHIPMVLDYHHYLCNNNREKIEDYIERIFATWSKTSLPPKIHFSSPKGKKKQDKRSHHDYIDVEQFLLFLRRIRFCDQDFDVMIEAKQKDRALFELVRQLRYLTDYTFLDQTTFLVM